MMTPEHVDRVVAVIEEAKSPVAVLLWLEQVAPGDTRHRVATIGGCSGAISEEASDALTAALRQLVVEWAYDNGIGAVVESNTGEN